jgi:hypothetical protein
MSDKPRVMMSGCGGGVCGAFLGMVIGGFIGPLIATSNHRDLRANRDARDPMAKSMSEIFDGCGAFFGMLVGIGAGGIVGGIGGSVLGSGLAARNSNPDVKEPPSEKDATQSPDSELARLKERIAELEAKKQEDADQRLRKDRNTDDVRND